MIFWTFIQAEWYHWLGLFMTIAITGWITYGLTKPATYTESPHIVLKEVKPKTPKPTTKATKKPS